MDKVKRFIAALVLGAGLAAVPAAVASADETAPRAVATVTAQENNDDDDGSGNWGLLGLLGLLGLAGLAGRKKRNVTDHNVAGR
ncbi:WGxxGxxG family protein [Saccharothrix sp. Mg75]|uniref:WGxxGxxG family protein n=1 Tax=Saccharothrix sp. Mg75 TaxID=3445357 RepID=UPI003EEBC32E